MSLLGEVLCKVDSRRQVAAKGSTAAAGVRASFAASQRRLWPQILLQVGSSAVLASAVLAGLGWWYLDREERRVVSIAEDTENTEDTEDTSPPAALDLPSALDSSPQPASELLIRAIAAELPPVIGSGAVKLAGPIAEPAPLLHSLGRPVPELPPAAQEVLAGLTAGAAETSETSQEEMSQEEATRQVAAAEGTTAEGAAAPHRPATSPAAGESHPTVPESDNREEGAPGIFVRRPSEPNPEQRARTLTEQGNTHLGAGDRRAAAEAYRQAIELDPSRSDARLGYANVLSNTGRSKRARHVLAAGLKHHPGQRRLSRYYAILADEAGDLEGAIEVLEAAVEPQRAGRLEAHLAALYRGTGRYRQAAELYHAMAAAEPDNVRWRAGYALAAEQLGELSEARQAWQEVLEGDNIHQAIKSHARERIKALRSSTDRGKS